MLACINIFFAEPPNCFSTLTVGKEGIVFRNMEKADCVTDITCGSFVSMRLHLIASIANSRSGAYSGECRIIFLFGILKFTLILPGNL